MAVESASRSVSRPRDRPAKPAITVDRILAVAFRLVETDGYDALTMRRVAAALETGPASLYAHVRNKAELDDLLIGDVCAAVRVPEPDPAHWQEQLLDVCRQLRDQYLRYPGISRAALAADPHSLDTLVISEGMLAICLAGGLAPQPAAWAIDAAFLYVSAYSFEASLRQHPGLAVDGRILGRTEMTRRLRELPVDRFPSTVAHADALTSGSGHERFDFTLRVLLRGLTTG